MGSLALVYFILRWQRGIFFNTLNDSLGNIHCIRWNKNLIHYPHFSRSLYFLLHFQLIRCCAHDAWLGLNISFHFHIHNLILWKSFIISIGLLLDGKSLRCLFVVFVLWWIFQWCCCCNQSKTAIIQKIMHLIANRKRCNCNGTVRNA